MRIAILLAGAALATTSAQAVTLREALVQVYQGNPSLTAARAQQRATDEGVPIARAAGLPQAGVDASFQEFALQATNNIVAPRRAASAGLSIGVPIYSGGQVRNGIRAADARVEAGRANLRSTEAGVFVETVSAYMNVIRDEAIVELNRGNVRVLQTNVQAAQDRFEVGDLTRTDVAQSQARLAIAQSQLQSALAQLDASRENYLRVVGTAPATLDAPPPLPAFPATPDDAVDVAVSNNPALSQARATSRAAALDVRVAESLRLPRVTANASGNYVNYLNSIGGGGLIQSPPNYQRSATLSVGVNLPLFQGGLPGARVRQAQAIQSQTLEQTTFVERDVVAQARTNYSLWTAAQAVITSSEQAVAANELALEGVRAENSVGTRNVLDVLNAEQELLNSRVQLVAARRDAYVAGFALLASLGKAEAKDLGLDGGPLYDPTVNYRRVRNSINDWAKDPEPQPVAATTLGVPSPTQVTVEQNRAATAPRNRLDAPAATTSPAAPPATAPNLRPGVQPPVTPPVAQPPGTRSHVTTPRS
ncbi:TolC family outer membrane protein [Sphingomonas jatrophae]|uniref:Outer membrane protein n=1 Tax=Sphingomonas jatrophae TaxID=1166337 RepID=A0A1I6JTD4_9SPHN|nr:TolC family outer membrane protein [Sphingomonas jatrophae]SFR82181.1 outer membrane protein [Sphingomonas jatrophae]